MSPDQYKSLYSPTPNKLIGTAQYPRPRKRGGSHDNRNGLYPNYVMRPQWHRKVTQKMKQKGTNPQTLEVYDQLFKDLPSASSEILKQLKQNAKTIAARKESRELKPIVIEKDYQLKYERELTDPNNRTKFFLVKSELLRQEGAQYDSMIESNLIKSDLNPLPQGATSTSDAMTMRRLDYTGRSFSRQSRSSKVYGKTPNSKTTLKSPSNIFKKPEDYAKTLKRKKHEKEIVVNDIYLKAPNQEVDSRPVLKGTLGVPIPSEHDLFQQARETYKKRTIVLLSLSSHFR